MKTEMDKEKSPLVSIGVPVFNEQRYIAETLKCLVEQSYPNIEIIVSDNCSTDDTAKICEQFAAENPRVKFHQMDVNYGPAANFNTVLELANGEYFMWASGHDRWQPEFIQSCVDTFAKHKDAVLVFGESEWIDEEGQKLEREFGFSDTRGLHTIARYITVFWGHMNPILGLMRREALKDTVMLNMVGTDLVILSDLVIKGDFVFAPGAHWSRRDFRMEQSYAEKLKRYKSKDYGLTGQSWLTRTFPLLQLPAELLKVVTGSAMAKGEKALLISLLLIMFPFRYIAGKYLQKLKPH